MNFVIILSQLNKISVFAQRNVWLQLNENGKLNSMQTMQLCTTVLLRNYEYTVLVFTTICIMEFLNLVSKNFKFNFQFTKS